MNTKRDIKELIKKRTVMKTVFWRVLSTCTTFLVAFFVTGNLKVGGLIALVEAVVKTIQYYFHEKWWEIYTKKKISTIKKKYKKLKRIDNVSSIQKSKKSKKLKEEKPWYVYIIKCKDGSLYTGITTNIERRLSEHGTKKGAKYTRNKGPFEILYTSKYNNRSEATKEECRIKKLKRIDKISLIESIFVTQNYEYNYNGKM